MSLTSPTIDHEIIESVVSAPTRMDSLHVGVISERKWEQFVYNMKTSDPEKLQKLVQPHNLKLCKRLISSDMTSPSLHQVAKLGKTDVMELLLDLGQPDVNKIDDAHKTALHYAAQEGHVDIVNMLYAELNINPTLRDRGGNTALHYAAKHGHELVVDMLLDDPNASEIFMPKVDVNSTNHSGKTALILAVEKGHGKVVDMLLKVPGVVFTSNAQKSTPLHAAAQHGHASIVGKILPKMDVNSTKNNLNRSPLHLAVEGDHENVVDLLLNAPNVNPSLEDSEGNTPLHMATMIKNGVIFEKLLQRPEVDANSANKKGEMALHLAARNKHSNIVMKLLEEPNVDPCPKTKNGKTPIHIAAMSGGVDVVRLLLATTKNVDDVNITDSKKRTPIHWAIIEGHLNVLEELLRVPNVAPSLGGDDDDNTPLHFATTLGHRDIVERLLEIPHLNVNKVNKKMETPLLLAARKGSIDVVDLLLGNPKVDISICDHRGDSPFYAAIKGGHADIVEKLLTPPRMVPIHSIEGNLMVPHQCIGGGYENSVDILLNQSTVVASAKDARGNSPLHYTAQNGNTCIFQKILEVLEVDVNSVNDHLDTPLHVAIKSGHVGVVNLLLGMQETNLNANLQNQDGDSALHVATKYGEEEIIKKLLEVDGVDVNAKNEDGVTALELAAEEGDVGIFDILLEVQDVHKNAGGGNAEKGLDKPFVNNWGILSLLLAARNGHVAIIKSLLAHACGVDVNGTHDYMQGTALSLAIEHGHPKVVEELLNAQGIDPNRRNENDEHPLFLAAKCGQGAIIMKLLARSQIDVNVLSDGETALHGAARNGREKVVDILLSTRGVDVHIKNVHGGTALHHAARADNKTILKAIYNASKRNVESEKGIVQKKLDIDDKNIYGESIIHFAAQTNSLNVMDFLLEVFHDDARCVDANLETSSISSFGVIPQSALQIAIEREHYSIVEKLTKFDSISFTEEVDGKVDGKTVLQDIFDKKQGQGETYKIVRRTKEATDYIDALYKDRQASIDAANAILVGAALIAGVTFASWLQPPLGYATYYHEQFSDSLPAPPTAYPEYAAFDHHPSLQAFWVFNSLSFFSAIATVISGARSVLPARKYFIKQEVEILRWNLLITSILLGFSMFFVLLAFATAGVIVLPPVMKFRSNIFSTIGIGGSVCFMFLFLFGKNIYKLLTSIESSQASTKGFFECWDFKSWLMQNPFTRRKGSED